MSDEKIFNNDSNLPLKSTTKRPMDSRRDIDGELAKWGIKRVMWNWDLNNGICEITFELPKEKFKDVVMNPAVRLTPPIVWKKKGRYKSEIDWRLSIRLLFWYIHYQLAWVYANQSSPIVAFLSHIQTGKNKTVKDTIIPMLSNWKALPEKEQPNIIECKKEND